MEYENSSPYVLFLRAPLTPFNPNPSTLVPTPPSLGWISSNLVSSRVSRYVLVRFKEYYVYTQGYNHLPEMRILAGHERGITSSHVPSDPGPWRHAQDPRL